MADTPRLRNVKPQIGTLRMAVAAPAPKRADAHYLSPEHRAWRAVVLARAANRCQSLFCETPQRGSGRRLFADHIVEIKDGGAALDPENGQALCGSCHALKTVSARASRMAQLT